MTYTYTYKFMFTPIHTCTLGDTHTLTPTKQGGAVPTSFMG